MAKKTLPLTVLRLPLQRYSCHACGDCCRDFTVQLRPEDLERLERQAYALKMGEPVTVEYRGMHFLRQKPDGACLFLESDGRCRVHADHGFDEKPIACRMFPFNLAPDGRGPHAGLNFACVSVRRNVGATLASHQDDLKRALRQIPEVRTSVSPRLAGSLRAELAETESIIAALDRWLQRDVPLIVRLDGFAWLAQSLGAARFESVRGARVKELVDVLESALPQELDHLPIDRASRGQQKLLRQAVFARIEDLTISEAAESSGLRGRLDQWRRSRQFSTGRGVLPSLPRGWDGPVSFDAVAQFDRTVDEREIDDLLSRWLRATILGGRAWGAGFYGFSIVEGLQALALNIACVGWLAKVHAVGRGAGSVDLEAVGESLGRIDRSAGRAKWLGSKAERLRLRYFASDDGLRRLVRLTWSEPIPAESE